MSELSRAQQVAARENLAKLERAVDDLDDAGMDVRLMRGTIALVRAELGEDDRAATIEGWLRAQPYETVISYRVRFSPGGQVYTFAAVKVSTTALARSTHWYTTAKEGTRQFSSRDLAGWLANDVTLIDCYRTVSGRGTGVTTVRPGVEMERP